MRSTGKMIEIALICLGGLITVGLSINSIIKSNKQEKELKEKQDSLIQAQKKISDKSEKIIQLQGQLNEMSKIQIEGLKRLNNPVPDEFNLSLFSSINVNTEEYAKLREIAIQNGNLLPANTADTGVERFDKLKDAQVIIEIVFKKEDKTMDIVFSQTPIEFIGFNTKNRSGTFLLGILNNNRLSFITNNILTRDITTNYPSPSMVDFYNSDVSIKISFGFPLRSRIGGQNVVLYTIGKQNNMSFSIDKIYLKSKKLSINIDSFKEIGTNKFESKWKTEYKE